MKKKFNKSFIVGLLIGAIMFGGIGFVLAEELISSKEISYTKSNGETITVDDAILELYGGGLSSSSDSDKLNEIWQYTVGQKDMFHRIKLVNIGSYGSGGTKGPYTYTYTVEETGILILNYDNLYYTIWNYGNIDILKDGKSIVTDFIGGERYSSARCFANVRKGDVVTISIPKVDTGDNRYDLGRFTTLLVAQYDFESSN